MKWALKIVAGLVGLFVVLMIAQSIASEQGEVVVLSTHDATGETRITRVWVVDLEGQAWLRSGSPSSAWYQRLSQNPQVRIERGGAEFLARATPVLDKQDAINELMSAKYGWADQFIGVMFGRDDAIPLRVDRVL
jgi:hypothetical protein